MGLDPAPADCLRLAQTAPTALLHGFLLGIASAAIGRPAQFKH